MHHHIRRTVGLSVVAAAIALLAPTPAAAEPDPCEAATIWGEQIIARVDLPLPDPWTVALRCGDSDWLGYADGDTSTVILWPELHTSADLLLWAYVHEIGHAYDMAYLTPDDRAAWRRLRDIDLAPDWWTYTTANEMPDHEQWRHTPAEDLADVFAACVLGWSGDHDHLWWRPAYAGPPAADECDIMWSLLGTTPTFGSEPQAVAAPGQL